MPVLIANGETAFLHTKIRAARAYRGYTPFYQFPEGETRITLVKKLPEPHDRYEGRMNFYITVNKESYLWSITKIGPIYRQLLDAMQRDQTAITVIRVGQGRNTRWSLKP
jgi:hypothetical protein